MGNSCGTSKTAAGDVDEENAPLNGAWQEKYESAWRHSITALQTQLEEQKPALAKALDNYDVHDDSDPATAGQRSRRSTDSCCCWIFLGSLVALAVILAYAGVHGDVRKLHHGIDYHGRVCGIDNDVRNEPYLYWCPAVAVADKSNEHALEMQASPVSSPVNTSVPARRLGGGSHHREEVALPKVGADRFDSSSSNSSSNISSSIRSVNAAHLSSTDKSLIEKISYDRPMCVKSCPRTDEAERSCWQGVSSTSEHGEDGWMEHVKYRFASVQDYPTVPVAGYCLPAGLKLRHSLGGRLDSSTEVLRFHASQIKRAWPALLAVAAFAVALGFIYLLLLSVYPGALIFATLALAVIVPLVAGGLSVWGWYLEDEQHTFLEQHGSMKVFELPATGDDASDLLVSIALVGAGLTMAILACCMRQSISIAVRSVDAACDCMFSMPSLLLEPLLSIALGLCTLIGLFVGFEKLRACGDVEQHARNSSTFVPGFSRYMVYHDLELLYVWAYLMIAAWVVETGTALRTFAVAFATQRWYFQEYFKGRKATPPLSLLEGFFLGITRHLGSMALGALCIPPLRLAQWLHARMRRGRVNVKGPLVAECLGCWAFWDSIGRLMHNSAYVMMAIDSLPFFPAAQKASNIRSTQLERVGDPNGFMWIFQVWGVVTVSGLSSAFAWFLVGSINTFTDQASPHYVDNATAIAVTGAAIGLGIGATFMHALRSIADTIVFCYALEGSWRAKHGLAMRGNVPPALQSYLDCTGFLGVHSSNGTDSHSTYTLVNRPKLFPPASAAAAAAKLDDSQDFFQTPYAVRESGNKPWW